MSLELELKLEVDAAGAALLRTLPVLAGAPESDQRQVTVYYDTPDGALAAAGFSLRVRSIGGRHVQTVKPIEGGAGLFTRDEREWPVVSDRPEPARLAELVPGLSSLPPLEATVRADVRRISWRLVRADATVQVDWDDGEMVAGGRSHHFIEIEFELVGGSAEGLIELARYVAQQVPVRLGVLTKAERGALLAEGKLGKVIKSAPVAVTDGQRVAEAFSVIAHACLKHYRLNEPLVIERREAAALHQCRVAMRRLRSSLWLFRPAIADDLFPALREELRWFTNQLGDARNLDVYLTRDHPEAERTALLARREQAYDQAIGAMDSQRLRLLLLDLIGWVALGAWRSGPRAAKPIRDFAVKRLDKLWSGIAAQGPLLAELDEDVRHELRIQVKKMRYAVEFLEGLYPAAVKKQNRFVEAIEGLQEALGRLNDLATARTLAPAATDWWIEPPEDSEDLKEAEHFYRDLARVGPFWRGA